MVSLVVLAIVIHHMVALDPPHGPVLLLGQPARPERRGGDGVAPGRRVGRAAAGLEIGVLSHKWLVLIVSFVFAILCGP